MLGTKPELTSYQLAGLMLAAVCLPLGQRGQSSTSPDTTHTKEGTSEQLALSEDTFFQAVSDVGEDTLSLPVTSQCHLEWLPSLFKLRACFIPPASGKVKWCFKQYIYYLRHFFCETFVRPLMTLRYSVGVKMSWACLLQTLLKTRLSVCVCKLWCALFFLLLVTSSASSFTRYFLSSPSGPCRLMSSGWMEKRETWLVAKAVSQIWPHSVVCTHSTFQLGKIHNIIVYSVRR